MSNPVLHALCLSVQQSCTLVHDLLLNGHVCEVGTLPGSTFPAADACLSPPGNGRPRDVNSTLPSLNRPLLLKRRMRTSASTPLA